VAGSGGGSGLAEAGAGSRQGRWRSIEASLGPGPEADLSSFCQIGCGHENGSLGLAVGQDVARRALGLEGAQLVSLCRTRVETSLDPAG
jgi:hypothetical protein